MVTALKSQLIKGNAKIKFYWTTAPFKWEILGQRWIRISKATLALSSLNFQTLSLEQFIKKNILRISNSPLMTKTLRKAILNRSKLKNIYNRNLTKDNWVNYRKERNFCVNLLRKTKNEYFQNLNMRDLLDNKMFWQTIISSSSNKESNSNRFFLKEKGNLVSNKKQLATITNNFFINAHPSVERIRRNIKINKKLFFQQVTEDLVPKIILNIDNFKDTPVGDIPADNLKCTVDIHPPFTNKIINLFFENNCFPDDLNLAEVGPVFKKNNDLDKGNHRPVSVLCHVLKVFERIVCTITLIISWKTNSQIYWLGLERIISHSIAWCACLKCGRTHWRLCLCNVYGLIKGFWQTES